MNFLPDIEIHCDDCNGKRYNRDTLAVKFKGKSISDILNLTINEAVEFFINIPTIHRRIKTLQDVGLGYMNLGQSSTTLSGGEAQRIKLASELAKKGWETLWTKELVQRHRLYQFGLKRLMSFDESLLRSFFATFFKLPKSDWSRFMANTLPLPELVLVMLKLFFISPLKVKLGMIGVLI